MFELTSEEKMRLKNLNNDKAAVFALKKLFLNVCTSSKSESVNELAAERMAQDYIKKTFHELSVIQPDNARGGREENPV